MNATKYATKHATKKKTTHDALTWLALVAAFIVTLTVLLMTACTAQQLQRFDDTVASPGAVEFADTVEPIVTAVRPLLPEPIGTLVAAVSGLTVGLIRASHNRRTARNLAKAIERNKTDSGTISFANPVVATKLSTDMGRAARRIVDEAQGKKTNTPF